MDAHRPLIATQLLHPLIFTRSLNRVLQDLSATPDALPDSSCAAGNAFYTWKQGGLAARASALLEGSVRG